MKNTTWGNALVIAALGLIFGTCADQSRVPFGDGGPAESPGGSSDEVDTGPVVSPGTPLTERIEVSRVTVPEGVKEGSRNFRIWGSSSLHVAPVFTVPLESCDTLVGFTTEGGAGIAARVAHLDRQDGLVSFLELGPLELRGLAAEPDGHFAALLWNDDADTIQVTRFALDGRADWTTPLVNADNSPDNFGIGESRFEHGDGRYGAYYHVHSDSGHEGDTLKWVDAATGAESTGWDWGCSHSMSNLLRYHPSQEAFLPACVTDCYPGTSGDFTTNSRGGIYLNHNDAKIMDVDGGCNGNVAGELGGAAVAQGGWKMVFNAHQNPMTPGQGSYDPDVMNQDIGFASISADLGSSALVWLTATPTVNEADSSIAGFQPAGDAEQQYVVGWSEPGDETVYKLARVDGAGAFLEGPVDASATVRWGRRDDPFRAHANGDVVWSWFDDPGSTTLNVAHVRSGNTCPAR